VNDTFVLLAPASVLVCSSVKPKNILDRFSPYGGVFDASINVLIDPPPNISTSGPSVQSPFEDKSCLGLQEQELGKIDNDRNDKASEKRQENSSDDHHLYTPRGRNPRESSDSKVLAVQLSPITDESLRPSHWLSGKDL
jgi:hypothetical protein